MLKVLLQQSNNCINILNTLTFGFVKPIKKWIECSLWPFGYIYLLLKANTSPHLILEPDFYLSFTLLLYKGKIIHQRKQTCFSSLVKIESKDSLQTLVLWPIANLCGPVHLSPDPHLFSCMNYCQCYNEGEAISSAWFPHYVFFDNLDSFKVICDLKVWWSAILWTVKNISVNVVGIFLTHYFPCIWFWKCPLPNFLPPFPLPAFFFLL